MRVERAGCVQGRLDLKLESPCCSYFSLRTRCTAGSDATLAESSSKSKSCESHVERGMIQGVPSRPRIVWLLDKSFLIKPHASSSCLFVTTTADLHSAVLLLAAAAAAVPTPTASGAARLTAACMAPGEPRSTLMERPGRSFVSV